MVPSEHVTRLRSMLRAREQLLLEGANDRDLRRAVADGRLLRPMQGWYVRRSEWERLSPEDRHLLCVLAVHESAVRPPVFCSLSAAILHGLPVYGFVSSPVHTLCPPGRRASDSRGVKRHAWARVDGQVVEIAGLTATNLPRTLADVARSMTPERAIGCLDAGVSELVGPITTDPAAREHACGIVIRALEQLPRGNGSARARGLVELADPLAESPLESVSRLYLVRLGFEVATQVEVPAPRGGTYRIDFEFLGQNAFGEVDGKSKYTDAAARRGLSAEEIVYREKTREDWIRGTEGKRMARWGRSSLGSAAALGVRLGAFGLVPPRRAGSPAAARRRCWAGG